MLPFDPPRLPIGAVEVAPAFEVIGPSVSELLVRLVPAEVRGGDAAADLRLAVTEALNNVVEHSGHPPWRPVRVHFGAEGEVHWVCVEDAGMPLPRGLLDPAPAEAAVCEPVRGIGHDPPAPALPVADMPEGGWGWLLIRGSVDRLDHVREMGRNFLLLTKTIG